jgi:hypothetical protein
VAGMPKEITNVEEFQKLSDKASECKIKKLGDITKLKLRTASRLYTIKLEAKLADELLAKITCPKNEIQNFSFPRYFNSHVIESVRFFY